jgi:hypothetical protein
MSFLTMTNAHILLIVIFVLMGCSTNYDSDLKEAVHRYYKYEMSKSWDKTYEMRSKTFRQAIEFSHYKEKMEEDYKGWTLANYSIKDISDSEGEIVVIVEFNEIPSDEYKKSHFIPSTIDYLTIVEESIWRKESNIWVSVSPGQRYVLTLNTSVE